VGGQGQVGGERWRGRTGGTARLYGGGKRKVESNVGDDEPSGPGAATATTLRRRRRHIKKLG